MPARTRMISTPWLEGVAALAVAALLVTACDTSVRTFVPRDGEYFSIFGALDVAADTQYIRVEALADSMQVGASSEIDATVTLEHLGSGRTFTLRDTFMEVHAGDSVHNFWTTEPIEPGARYRLRVQRSDGALSQATTTLPESPPELAHDSTFYLPCADGLNTFAVTVQGVEEGHLAALWVIYVADSARTNVRRFRFDHLDEAVYLDGSYEVPIDYRQDIEQIATLGDLPTPCTNPAPSHALVAGAAGGPDWPAFGEASLNVLARPDTFSNVDNGHGLLVGVYSDTIQVRTRERPN